MGEVTDAVVADAGVVDLVGNTPLVRLHSVTSDLNAGVEVWAKLEGCNPGGSVKDRPALNMIRSGIESGALTPEKTIIDATSGNTGLAYAMIGTALGYKVCLCVPSNVTPERLKILNAFGVEVVPTDPAHATDGAILKAREIYASDPDRYFYPDQYENEANWKAHYNSTGIEVWEQTEGRVTHFLAGLGTTGTMMGTGRRLREYNPDIVLISGQPDSPFHGLEGWKHMETAMVPGIYDPALCDRNIEIKTENAQEMVMRLAREEGMMVSPSSGASCVGALQVASELESGCVVAIFPDDATKYLSENFWTDL